MPDLFSTDLDSLSWADVEDFVGLGEDRSGRPEGPRVQFKRELTVGAFETVVRMANEAGGLICLSTA